jgi:hypothetical protein
MMFRTLAIAAFAALCAHAAQAKQFVFTYTETSSTPTDFTATLRLTTTDVLVNGHYTITGVTGSFAGPSLPALDTMEPAYQSTRPQPRQITSSISIATAISGKSIRSSQPMER